jgi:N-acetylmuramoyl-L-alanine amidase
MLEVGIMCLALNIYHEARGEPLVGQIAVAEVVLNRVESPRFPDTICGVVKEGEYVGQTPVKNRCQFSWWCDGKSDKPKDSLKWEQSVNLAYTMIEHPHVDITEGALFYHAVYVNPSWAKHYEKITTIDNHIFYR